MAGLSVEIANEFIRRAIADKHPLTQMQLQKLVYIAHGWNLAINGAPLTIDSPQAWEYGPVYRELYSALSRYGRGPVVREVVNSETMLGAFDVGPEADKVAVADLTEAELAVITRVYRDYSKFHAYQLSALTHRENTPWTQVYDRGNGKFEDIPDGLIKEHFVALAHNAAA